jgi:hypothetical protein
MQFVAVSTRKQPLIGGDTMQTNKTKTLRTAAILAGALALSACGPLGSDELGDEPNVDEQHLGTGGGGPTATITTVAAGSGWRTLSATGTMQDAVTGAYRSVTNDQVYVVTGTTGINSVPLPSVIRNQLSSDLQLSLATGEIKSANEAVYFVHKATAEKVAAGTLKQVPVAKQGVKTYALCGDYNKTLQKTVSFDKSVTYSYTSNSSSFTGELSLDGRIKGMATGKVKVRIKRALCVPYWAKLINMQFSGNLDAQARLVAKGNFSKQWSWNKQVAKFHVGSFSTFVGPLWVHVGMNVPFDLGLEASAKASADLDGTVTANGSFDVICTGDGCGGSKTFTHGFAENKPPSFSVTGRVKVKPWIQGSVRTYLYSESVAYGQLGVKAALDGDLWFYSGNTCGDSDNDGTNEYVNALTLDADLDLDLTAKLYVVGILDKKWSWGIGRWHVGFWDLLPGGSSALEPIFYRKTYAPGTVVYDPSTPGGLTFQGRMRPCWPYSDKVTYKLDFKDGTVSNFTLKPYVLFTTSYAFSGATPSMITLTAQNDAHNRSVNTSTDAATSSGWRPQRPTFPSTPLEIAR